MVFFPFLSSCEFSDVSSAQQTLLGLKELFEEKAVYFCCSCCLLPFIIPNPIFMFIFFIFPRAGLFCSLALGRWLWQRQHLEKPDCKTPEEHLPSCSKGHPRLPKPPLG